MRLRNRRPQPEPEVVVDLREPAAPQPVWGSPVPCPECKSRGYLDHIDPYKEVMYLHCTECGTRYQFTKDEFDRVIA